MSGAVVIGLGRPQYGDDALGLLAAAVLAERLAGVARVSADGSGAVLLDGAPGAGLLVLVDAAHSGARLPAGHWQRLRYPRDAARLKQCPLRDTHAPGLGAVLALAHALDLLPGDTWLYAVGGTRFAPECPLSAAVAASLPALTTEIERAVRRWLHRCA